MYSESLKAARKRLLSQLNDPNVSRNGFYGLLEKAEHGFSSFLEEFQPAASNNDISQDAVNWSSDYFDRHSLLAEYNFSRERIEHLLDVREHLIQLGVRGFVPSASLSIPKVERKNDMATELTPSPYLQDFVSKGELFSIRIALYQEFRDNSLTGADLRAAISWVESQIPGLFDAYSEQKFARGMESSDRQQWNSQYYDTQGVYLTTNFSKERLLHLIDVRDFLREEGVDGFVALPPKPPRLAHASTQEQRHGSQFAQKSSGHRAGSPNLLRNVVGSMLEDAGTRLRDFGIKIKQGADDGRGTR